MRTMCPNTALFEIRWDRAALYRCAECGRVARTDREHQVPGPTTRSHDKTMAILWDMAVTR